ncbi:MULTISPECIES: FecR family protein [unclassified Beijerinckia]|uniref:FecR family protein n=1 Tax=unclassified Beijerinckia TaxID=2638183 RepID=UPI00089B3F42|nr:MULTISPECIES: FecR family protein [unclassified Beijerinckia]MDH7797105.1 transmembrane sensor [Beijerinckia sp. GAS462]SEC72407.1 FecR family protein [Beijerinckia sp. 28-YEA-48]
MKEDATDPIVMEALEWFVRMRDHTVDASDRRAFDAWLAADTAHVAAWQRAETLWKRFDIAQPEFDRARRSRTLSRRKILLGTLVAAAGGGLYILNSSYLAPDYATDIGERRTFTLADGSTVELGSDSALSVQYTDRIRQLVLHRGQGFFDVTADSKRPFIVRAADGAVQALGTRFDVKYIDDVVTVAVSQHAVLVQAGSQSGVRIDHGWQVSYGSDGLSQPSPANLDTIEAWRRDRLVFQDVPLARVLTELGRYRRGRIILIDKQVGNIPVTAIFDTKQADNALRTIADTLPIRVLYATNYLAFVSGAR